METTRTLPSSAACGRQLPPKGKPLELAAASVYALRAAFGGCAPTRACGRSPSGEAFRTGGSPSGGAFRTDRSLLPLGEKVSAAPPADG